MLTFATISTWETFWAQYSFPHHPNGGLWFNCLNITQNACLIGFLSSSNLSIAPKTCFHAPMYYMLEFCNLQLTSNVVS